MVHMDSFIKSLKCSWVRRLGSPNNNCWKVFFNISLRKYGGTFLFKCNMHPNDFTDVRNTFITVLSMFVNLGFHIISMSPIIILIMK